MFFPALGTVVISGSTTALHCPVTLVLICVSGYLRCLLFPQMPPFIGPFPFYWVGAGFLLLLLDGRKVGIVDISSQAIIFKKYLFLFCTRVFCLPSCLCAVPKEARRGQWIL